jgi:hypothetical protein
VAGDYAAGAPAALGGRRMVPPLLLDIPGRVYERPAETPASERSRWGAASARCSEATPCGPAHLAKAGVDLMACLALLGVPANGRSCSLNRRDSPCWRPVLDVQAVLSACMQRVHRHSASDTRCAAN